MWTMIKAGQMSCGSGRFLHVRFCRIRATMMSTLVVAKNRFEWHRGLASAVLPTTTYDHSRHLLAHPKLTPLHQQKLKAFTMSSSPFDPKSAGLEETTSITPGTKLRKPRKKFIPPKAAVQLTERARLFFKALLQRPPRADIVGILLSYHQSQTGEPRMVFSFDYCTAQDVITDDDDEGRSLVLADEAVSLEVLPDGSPKPPIDSRRDGLPKLYVSHQALLKVLGATVDVDPTNGSMVLYNQEGQELDPNA